MCEDDCGCTDKSICPHYLNFHTDVAKTPPLCDEVLIYDCEMGKWRPGKVTIEGIEEFCIDLESLVDNQVYFLEWTGTCLSVDVPNLDDMSDVVLTNPTDGQGLLFDGDNWVNSDNPPAHTLGFHSNVDGGVDSADAGDLLRFNGTDWEASTTLPPHSLGSHSNVNISADSASNGDTLTYNGSEWVPTAGAGTHTLGSHSNVLNIADTYAGTYGYVLKSGLSGQWGPFFLNINDNIDVQTSAPVVGQVLRWNGALWTNGYVSGGGGGGSTGGTIVGAVQYPSPSGPWTKVSGTGFSVNNSNGGTIVFDTPMADGAAIGIASDDTVKMGANLTSQWVFGLGSPPTTLGVTLSFVAGPT